MIGKKAKYIHTATFVLILFTYSFWSLIKEFLGVQIFYKFTALSFVGFTYVIYRYAKSDGRDKNFIILTNITYLSAFSNLFDELFFDPTKIQLNEYVAFIILILVTLYNYREKWER